MTNVEKLVEKWRRKSDKTFMMQMQIDVAVNELEAAIAADADLLEDKLKTTDAKELK